MTGPITQSAVPGPPDDVALGDMTGLEILRYMTGLPERPPNIAQLVGMDVDSLEEGRVSFSLAARPDMTNPIGSLHGGICATLLDSVMGCAVHTTLGPGVGYGTLELKVNYIRSVPTDGRRIIGYGKTIHVGRRTATAEGEIRDERDKLIAHGTTTCIIHQPA